MEQKIANEPVSWKEMLPKEHLEGFFGHFYLSYIVLGRSASRIWEGPTECVPGGT